MNKRFQFLSGFAAILLLSSCADPGLYYPAGGFPVGGGPAPVVVDQVVGVGPYGPGGWGPGWGGGWNRGWGWGGGGWGRGWGGGPYYGNVGYRCNRCNRNPCACSHHHHHPSSNARSSSNPNDRKYRILAGDLGGKKKPNDFHSLDWYHDRGYSLQNLKIETDRGAVIDKRPSAQRSSSPSSSRGSSSSASKSKSSSSSSSGRPVSTSNSNSNSLSSHVKGEYMKKR